MILQRMSVSRQPCPSMMGRHTAAEHSLHTAIPVLLRPSNTACLGKRGMLGLQLGGQFRPSRKQTCGGRPPSTGGRYRQNKVACQAAGSQAAVQPSEEEARAKLRFLAQAVGGSGGQGEQNSALDAAIALLEEAASSRQVGTSTPVPPLCACISSAQDSLCGFPTNEIGGHRFAG